MEAPRLGRDLCEQFGGVHHPTAPPHAHYRLREGTLDIALDSHEDDGTFSVVLENSPVPPLVVEAQVHPRLRRQGGPSERGHGKDSSLEPVWPGWSKYSTVARPASASIR